MLAGDNRVQIQDAFEQKERNPQNNLRYES